MNYIPLVSLLLWVSVGIGYIFFREIFILPAVIFPSLILLSILLPVSFWTLQAKERKLYSIVFVGIFLINNTVLVYGFFNNYATLNSLLEVTGKRIDPELAKLLVSGNSEKERSAVSRIIFQKHGIVLPFMTQDDLYALHVPTQADKDIFIDNHEKSYLMVLKKQNLSNQIITIFFLLALQVTIFFTLLIFLILYDRPPQQARKKLR